MDPTPESGETLFALLARAGRENPDRRAAVSLRGSVTYGDALRRARGLARGLEARQIRRFGCVLDDPGNALPLLAAASATGAEPCVYPSMLDPVAHDELAQRFGHETVVSDRTVSLQEAQLIAIEDLADPNQEQLDQTSTDSPLIILTTGTTGAQKGARHDWRRLSHALAGLELRPEARWLLTFNLNQFAGLQVLLNALKSGATLAYSESNHPRDAIRAIRELSVTHVSATPTFWRLLTTALENGESSSMRLEQITLGGEATDQALLDRLAGTFPHARLCHVYAGTEFGSVVSVCDGKSGLPQSVLSRGHESGAHMRITDGELEVRSHGGMLGYHAEASRAPAWHRTGDLVEVRDNRIHFIGRSSEIINVGGAKVHPLPVEETVGGVEGVRLVRASGRPNPITGNIVVVTVAPLPGVDTSELEQRIRQACEALPRAARPRRIEFVGEIETRGQKLDRRPIGGGS